MDEALRIRLIRAAKTGQLTEEEYQLYLKLLEEDPDFADEVEMEEFLDDNLRSVEDTDLYAASEKRVLRRRRRFPQRYAIAASIALLVIGGWLGWHFFMRQPESAIAAGTRFIEVYSGDDKPEGQLGYTEGDLPAAEIPMKWWLAKDQKTRLSYRLCADTLQIFTRELRDTTFFLDNYRLTYFTKNGFYFLESKDKTPLQLKTCTPEPSPLP